MVLEFFGSFLFGLALLAVGVVVLVVSTRYVWRATSIYRAEPSSIVGDTAPGTLVRLSGTAERGTADPLSAPFSGTECLALRYAVEERRLSPYLLPWFVTIHEQSGSTGFCLRTAGAVVDVGEPAHTVTLERTVVGTVAPGETPPEQIARFERTTDPVAGTSYWQSPPSILRPITRLLSLGTRRYIEQRAGPGDGLTVVGRVTEMGDGVDPIVVSDRPPGQTILRMAKTSLIGLSIGVFVVLLGLALVFL